MRSKNLYRPQQSGFDDTESIKEGKTYQTKEMIKYNMVFNQSPSISAKNINTTDYASISKQSNFSTFKPNSNMKSSNFSDKINPTPQHNSTHRPNPKDHTKKVWNKLDLIHEIPEIDRSKNSYNELTHNQNSKPN